MKKNQHKKNQHKSSKEKQSVNEDKEFQRFFEEKLKMYEEDLTLPEFEFVVSSGRRMAYMVLQMVRDDNEALVSAGNGKALHPDGYHLNEKCAEVMIRLLNVLYDVGAKGRLVREQSIGTQVPMSTQSELITSDQTEKWAERHNPSAMLKRYERFEKMEDFPFLMEMGQQGINSSLEMAERDLIEIMDKGGDLQSDPVYQITVKWVESMRRVKEILKGARERGASGFVFQSDSATA
ncbi:hypothetical protein [Rufibacter hautae]|uniref:Uncharacterized protein n=1 Tax=Rufibacter hautae TaxID=2595005 RepID=A0A5B6TM18_9BACT|nr:hypothetical protein [Rufibacter hautae]KAA3437142.1 hypothetical protein FOA19_22520 [Rufibacter hautae]